MKFKIIFKLLNYFKVYNKQLSIFILLTLITVSCCLLSEVALANTAASKDAFADVYTKLSGWIGGNAGKVITIIAVVVAALLGTLGFSGRHIMGAVGVGLLLSLATTVVDMIFG